MTRALMEQAIVELRCMREALYKACAKPQKARNLLKRPGPAWRMSLNSTTPRSPGKRHSCSGDHPNQGCM